MSKASFIVHCIHGFRKPKLYKSIAYAQKRCLKQPGFQITKCLSQEQANQLLKAKIEEHQRILDSNKVAILKTHLETASVQANSPCKVENGASYLQDNERSDREKYVNQIFCKQGFIATPNFKSVPFVVAPLLQYEGFFDGASKGNPGPSSVGYLLRYSNNLLLARSEYLGKFTNNQAQLMAMGYLLAQSFCSGVKQLKVSGDSKLAIQFMKGTFSVSDPKLTSLVNANKALSDKFSKIKFEHIRRQFNGEADQLASEAISRFKATEKANKDN